MIIQSRTKFSLLLFIFACPFLLHSHNNFESIPFKGSNDESLLFIREKQLPSEKWSLNGQFNLFLLEDKWASETTIGLLVETGSFCHLNGNHSIAHLVQHIISSKSNATFPEGTSLRDFTLQSGGSFYSWTGVGATGFVTSVPNYRLKGAMQRFKAMIQSPYFLIEDLREESANISEEFRDNLENDNSIRTWVALTENCNSEHPLFQSVWEESGQLSSISPDAIKNWFREHYHSSPMHMVIISPKSLETIRDEVLPILENLLLSDLSERPPLPEFINSDTFTWVPSQNNERSLVIAIPLEGNLPASQREEFFLTRLFSDERKALPQALLKETGLIEKLRAYFETSNSYLPTILMIEAELTQMGVQHWNQVLSELLFSILEFGKRSDVTAFLSQEKISQELLVAYPPYSNPQTRIFSLLNQMLSEPFDTFPNFSQKVQSFQFDPIAITKMLHKRPKSVILNCSSQEWFSINDDVPDKPLENVFLSQSFRTIPFFTCTLPKLPIPQIGNFLDIPDKNNFLPRKVLGPTLQKCSDNFSFYPEIFQNIRGQKAAFIQERCFGEPREIWHLRLTHPSMISSLPKDRALFLFLAEVLRERIKELSFEAKAAEAEVSLEENTYSLDLFVCGWIDCLDLMMKNILREIQQPLLLEEINFQALKQTVLKKFVESEQDLFQASLEILRDQICEPSISKEEQVKSVLELTLEECQEFYEEFRENSYPEGIFIGKNKRSPLATWEKMADCFRGNLPSKPKMASRLETGLNKIEVPRAPASSVLVAIDFGSLESIHGYTLASLLSDGLNQPFQAYQGLNRDVERAQVSLEEVGGHIFLTFYLQSSTNTPLFLQVQTEEFIQELLKNFDMPPFFHDDKFQNLKTQLASRTSLSAVNLTHWAHQLSDLALDRLSWRFWGSVADHAREIDYRSFKSYGSAILNLRTTRAFCIV
ncbi:insulinase family protein, partial [Candidatus Similichlamydia epinepheli]|uniref:insulinase family protein n=1 Tax=Candidatus Similichlamydia epinepheli TaxID=1903953 RepID=UPI001300B922